jgi:hypothetical protein
VQRGGPGGRPVSKILIVHAAADLRELWAMALTTDGHDVMVLPMAT